MFEKLKRWLKLQKEGILVGTAIAVFLYWRGWDLPIPIAETGIPKLAIMIFILSTIGALIDSVYKPNE